MVSRERQRERERERERERDGSSEQQIIQLTTFPVLSILFWFLGSLSFYCSHVKKKLTYCHGTGEVGTYIGIFQAMIRPPLFFSIDFNNWFNTRSQSRAFFFFCPPWNVYIQSPLCVYIKHNSNLTFWTAVTTEDLHAHMNDIEFSSSVSVSVFVSVFVSVCLSLLMVVEFWKVAAASSSSCSFFSQSQNCWI
jgi:hypothetical protein